MDQSGRRLDEALIESDDYGQAMSKLQDWARVSFYWKDL